MRIFKNSLFMFLLGAFIFSMIGVYATTLIQASSISYKTTNVENALNELYAKAVSNSQLKVLFENGEYYNQDKVQIILTGCGIVDNQIQISNSSYGIQTKGLDSKKHMIIYTLTNAHPGTIQWGTCTNNATYPGIIETGANRTGFNTSNVADTGNTPIIVMESSINSGTFLGVYGGTISISKIEYLEF